MPKAGEGLKSILLHMAPDPYHADRLRVALDLARRFNAFLEIAYVLSPVSMPAEIQGRAASAGYIAEAMEIARERAVKTEKEVRETCADAGIQWRWELLDGHPLRELIHRALFADLLIVSQDFGIGEEQVGIHTPGELVSDCPCPVLILPKDATVPSIGKTMLIAWKDSVPAAHAVRGARPLLEGADKVYILTCEPAHHRFEEGRNLVAYLKRYGVNAEQVSDVSGDGQVGPVILSYAEDLGVDVIVMGAFGRSRLMEVLSGGNTAHVLDNMRTPVLLSH